MDHGPGNYLQMCDRLYQQACEHDGIDPEAKIVMFSAGNPYAEKHAAVFNQERYDHARRVKCPSE